MYHLPHQLLALAEQPSRAHLPEGCKNLLKIQLVHKHFIYLPTGKKNVKNKKIFTHIHFRTIFDQHYIKVHKKDQVALCLQRQVLYHKHTPHAAISCKRIPPTQILCIHVDHLQMSGSTHSIY